MRRRVLSGLIATVLGAVAAGPVLAQAQPEQLGVFRDTWVAWKGNDAYGTICFISSKPQKTSPTQTADGKPINRDPPQMMVIHREKAPMAGPDGEYLKDANGNLVIGKSRNEVQVAAGYPLRPTSDTFFHSATVDGKRYAMRSVPDDPGTPQDKESESSWLASTDDEPGFIAALKAGNTVVFLGTSERSGLELSDSYSLAGFTAAKDAIDQACP